MKKRVLFGSFMGIAAALCLSGYTSTNHQATKSVSSPSVSGIATQIGRLPDQKTPIKIIKKGKNIVMLFPELKNNMGKNFEQTPCEVEFLHKGSYENPAAKVKSTTYFALLPKMNNNCALYLETRSAQYGAEKSPRYLIINEGKNEANFTISRDVLAQDPIIKGVLK